MPTMYSTATHLPGLARTNDPETSHAAAESIDASGLVRQIYAAMQAFGDEGCISDDVADALPDVGIQTFTPRFKQMIDRGMIEVLPHQRKGRCGRMQLVRRVLRPPFKPATNKPEISAVQREMANLRKLADRMKSTGPWIDDGVRLNAAVTRLEEAMEES